MAQRPVQWGFRNCSARAEMIYTRKSGSAHERYHLLPRDTGERLERLYN